MPEVTCLCAECGFLVTETVSGQRRGWCSATDIIVNEYGECTACTLMGPEQPDRVEPNPIEAIYGGDSETWRTVWATQYLQMVGIRGVLSDLANRVRLWWHERRRSNETRRQHHDNR